MKEVEDDAESIAPGELLATTSKLSHINEQLSTLLAQIDAVDLLLWHLANNPRTEVHNLILEQTKESLRQDIGELTRKKAKYESHEQREAIVPGQCTISIEAEHESHEIGEKPITFYTIVILRNETKVSWTVSRRYSDFDSLHLKLKKLFPVVQDFELPGKTLGGLWPRAKSDQAGRAKALEKYLQVLKT
jgi:PX domain